MIIENYVARELHTYPLDELHRAKPLSTGPLRSSVAWIEPRPPSNSPRRARGH